MTIGWFAFASMTVAALPAQDAAPADAAPAQEAAASDEIVVTGRREGTLDLDRLAAAQAVFARHRATYAPDARLWFVLAQADLPIRLSLSDGERRIEVPVDATGWFTLPPVPEGAWELLHDRGGRAVRVRALVLSQGAEEGDRPLGDLRLQCRVAWKLMKGEVGFMARAMFDTVDACGSRRVAIFFQTRRPIASATVDAAGGPRPLPVRASSFRPPLSDRALPNAARVRLTYR